MQVNNSFLVNDYVIANAAFGLPVVTPGNLLPSPKKMEDFKVLVKKKKRNVLGKYLVLISCIKIKMLFFKQSSSTWYYCNGGVMD